MKALITSPCGARHFFTLLISIDSILLSWKSINLYFWHWKYWVWCLLIFYECIYGSLQIDYKKKSITECLYIINRNDKPIPIDVEANKGLMQNFNTNKIRSNTEYSYSSYIWMNMYSSYRGKIWRISMSLSRSSLLPTAGSFSGVVFAAFWLNQPVFVSNISLLQNQQILYWTI